MTEHGLEADVRGKRAQHVRVGMVDGQLGARCTCAANVLGPPACRHVWATLLEIDRQALLPALRLSERTLALAELEATQEKKPKSPAGTRRNKAAAATRVARPEAPTPATGRAAGARKRLTR